MATYTVEKGDCLWTIAEKKLGAGYKWTELADLNNIPRDNPIIYVGQVLQLDGGSVTPSTPPKTNTTSKPAILYFGLQAGTDSSMFAVWSWDKAYTENYQVYWFYDTGNGVWFIGDNSTTGDKQSFYSAPSNALRVKFRVKPISKTHTVNKQETSYWTASWSTEREYSFSDNPPSVPSSAPTVEIEDYKLTATLDNLDINATSVQFQIVKDNTKVFNTGIAKITTGHASYSCTISPGGEYKVRARGVRGNIYGDWTEYSNNESTKPAASSGIKTIKAKSETSIYLEWYGVNNAESYDIEYTTKKEYFDGSDQTTIVSSIEYTHYEKTGLESGQEYFFRVRAVNGQGASAWSGIKSIVIGKKPSAPTTWSSTTTAMTGEPLTLYWVHNSEDGSSQTNAQIKLTPVGGTSQTITIPTSSEADDNKTMHYEISTSGYIEGTKLQWCVRTSGVTLAYSDWSVERTVDIYTPPSLSISVTNSSGEALETLKSFPFYISGIAGPNTQIPTGYHVVIASNEVYETTDNMGNVKMVSAGGQVYSKYFDTSSDLLIQLSAGNIDLENNISYTVKVTVSMDSGLIAEASSEFIVSWIDQEYEPNAEIGIDNDTLTAYIRPYCETETGSLVSGITLSVYRREFDGSFTELATGLKNSKSTFITDPHPALDYARYRVVAIANSTGAVSFYDVPGYPVGEKAVIIQWDEAWSNFEATSEDALEQPPWAGSLLKLPYNIDISDDHNVDVSLVNYIGRTYPVSYYGTQVGVTSSWNVEIVKSDKETLYALRRLSIYKGNVYVREPSGSGYWASISVSFSQKHCQLTIPVTFEVTRVEGGI